MPSLTLCLDPATLVLGVMCLCLQKVFFAKTKSDAVALKEGSFEPRAKRQKREEKELAKVSIS